MSMEPTTIAKLVFIAVVLLIAMGAGLAPMKIKGCNVFILLRSMHIISSDIYKCKAQKPFQNSTSFYILLI